MSEEERSTAAQTTLVADMRLNELQVQSAVLVWECVGLHARLMHTIRECMAVCSERAYHKRLCGWQQTLTHFFRSSYSCVSPVLELLSFAPSNTPGLARYALDHSFTA